MHKKAYSKETIIMTKKIKKENKNVAKKPFYKRVWFWILAIIAIFVIIGAIGGGSDSDTSSASKNNSSLTSESSSNSNNKNTIQSAAFRKAFDNINVGDLMSNGDGGTTLDDVEKVLGKPSSTSTTTIQGIETKSYIWVKGTTTITVQFSNNNVVSKHIAGFKFSRASKFNLDAYNSLADGSSYEDVVNEYGEPDGLSEMIIGGNKEVTATWAAKGGTATLQFTNDGLVSKAQTGLE